MKKHLRKISVIVFGTFVLSALAASPSHAGLFGSNSDTKKNVAAIRKLAVTETSLLKRYGAVTGKNYKDDTTTMNALIGLIPDINSFIDKFDALAPQDKKLQAAINLEIDGWNKQEEAMTLAIGAIQDQDYSKMAQSNAVLAKGRAILKKAATAFAPYFKM